MAENEGQKREITWRGERMLDALRGFKAVEGLRVPEKKVQTIWVNGGATPSQDLIDAIDELYDNGLADGCEGLDGIQLTAAGHARVYG